ncbi:MAG: hypothetical protein AB7S38_38565 [Vulcanimicrobiota bacterium]
MAYLTVTFLVLNLLLSALPAHAYLDPGSLGPLQQFGLMIVYGISSIFVLFFRPFKLFFMKLFGKKPAPPVAKEESEEADSEPEV